MLPKIIDLFSGCGGMTLGFEKAGFEIAAGIELMPEAFQTISYNLDYRYGKEEAHICGDIIETGANVFKEIDNAVPLLLTLRATESIYDAFKEVR